MRKPVVSDGHHHRRRRRGRTRPSGTLGTSSVLVVLGPCGLPQVDLGSLLACACSGAEPAVGSL
eukprot:9725993-Alexandrium_andersonii.AAC.1